jgi:hypothetical protein
VARDERLLSLILQPLIQTHITRLRERKRGLKCRAEGQGVKGFVIFWPFYISQAIYTRECSNASLLFSFPLFLQLQGVGLLLRKRKMKEE